VGTTILLQIIGLEDQVERLHVNYARELIYRLRLGQSDRAIARDLGISRITVRKYRGLSEARGYLDPASPLPEVQAIAHALGPAPRPPCPVSSVQPYRQLVEQFLTEGLEMMTIFDRLSKDHGYTGSYSSIRRFVHRLRPAQKHVTVRVHSGPGEEAQVDFGSAGMFLDPADGRLRQAYVFVMTLCFSRHQYAELVFDQKIPTWLALHRRAFESFGGVPAKIVPDNLKAAVLRAALHDPVLGEAYRRFAQHYGFLVSPTRPATPEHKGKVENGVHFVKRSFLAGQVFADIREANQKLAIWVRERAGMREHGTTHQPPLALFEACERAKLLPLPSEPFELCETKIAKLHPDCHVVVDGSYYSAPYEHVGDDLEVHVFERVVQIYRATKLLATHPRARKKGEWHTRNEHYPPDKAAFLEKTPERCRELSSRIGPCTAEVVQKLLAERPLDQLRSVQAILRLVDTVGPQRLEAACRRALFFGDGHYRRIKGILNAALDQAPLPEPAPITKPAPSFVFQRPVAEFFDLPEAAC
jgi:transposase